MGGGGVHRMCWSRLDAAVDSVESFVQFEKKEEDAVVVVVGGGLWQV